MIGNLHNKMLHSEMVLNCKLFMTKIENVKEVEVLQVILSLRFYRHRYRDSSCRYDNSVYNIITYMS